MRLYDKYPTHELPFEVVIINGVIHVNQNVELEALVKAMKDFVVTVEKELGKVI